MTAALGWAPGRPRIAVLDCGIGNLRSVEKAFHAGGHAAVLTRDPALLADATHLVLPGVGAFGDFMARLGALGLDAVVVERARSGTPLLGICVGMQVLFDEGEEFGRHRGLGLLPGRVVRLPDGDLPVPHNGWNRVRPTVASPLLPSVETAPWFYFVHSYHCAAERVADVIGVAEYGVPFVAACGRDALFGVQFHPEKSQAEGLSLLSRFAAVTAHPCPPGPPR